MGISDNMEDSVFDLPRLGDVAFPNTRKKPSNEHILEMSSGISSAFQLENVFKKQNLLSFSHLLDFRDIEEHSGTILLPQLPPIQLEEIENFEREFLAGNGGMKSSPTFGKNSPSLFNQVKSIMSTLFTPSSLPQPGLLLSPMAPLLVNPTVTTNLRKYTDHQTSSTSENLKSTLVYYLLQEMTLNPISDIRHSTLIHIIQALTVTLYFRKNFVQVMQTVANHRQFAPMRQALLEFKQQLTTHLACGTAVVALGDIFDGTVTDLWLSLGCLALLIIKSKIEKHKPSKLFISYKTKLEQ